MNKNIMLNLGASTLQEFHSDKFYHKKFNFEDYNSIIAYQPLIELYNYCCQQYKDVKNLVMINEAVSAKTGIADLYIAHPTVQFDVNTPLSLIQENFGSAASLLIYKNSRSKLKRQITSCGILQVLDTYDINEYDNNVLVCDIQGIQYQVIQQLLLSDRLKVFSSVYMEFHRLTSMYGQDRKYMNQYAKKIQNQFFEYCQQNNINVVLQSQVEK